MTIPAFLLDIVGGDAAAPAYVFVDVKGREIATLSRGELNERTTRVACSLVAARARRTAIVLPPGPELVIAFIASLRAQAVPVICEPRGRKLNAGDRLDAILNNCKPSHVITTEVEAACLLPTDSEVFTLPALESLGTPLIDPLPPCQPGQPAYLQYTSGSTGPAKGTMVTFKNLADNLTAIIDRMALSADSVGISWLPPYHDMGLVGGLMAPLEARFPAIWMRTEDFVRRPITWLELIDRYRATISGGPMFGWRQTLARCHAASTAGLDLSCWKVAFVGAEPIDPAVLAAFGERFRENGFDAAAFLPCYGLAEATLFVAAIGPGEGVRERTRADGSGIRDVICGRPWKGLDTRIIDRDTGIAVADGSIGEICLAGSSVANDLGTGFSLATLKVEGAPHLFMPTGDLGYLRDGSLSITGRIKSMIKVHGRKLIAEDIEASVRADHPSVLGVVAYSPTHSGAQADQLEIILEVEKDEMANEIRNDVSTAITRSFGVVPARVRVVPRGGIPRTVSGKVDRGRAAMVLRKEF